MKAVIRGVAGAAKSTLTFNERYSRMSKDILRIASLDTNQIDEIIRTSGSGGGEVVIPESIELQKGDIIRTHYITGRTQSIERDGKIVWSDEQ